MSNCFFWQFDSLRQTLVTASSVEVNFLGFWTVWITRSTRVSAGWKINDTFNSKTVKKSLIRLPGPRIKYWHTCVRLSVFEQEQTEGLTIIRTPTPTPTPTLTLTPTVRWRWNETRRLILSFELWASLAVLDSQEQQVSQIRQALNKIYILSNRKKQKYSGFSF